MRLIDADAVKQNILEVINKQGGKSKDLIPVRELPLFIDIQPTAYDIVKVVEELEERKEEREKQYKTASMEDGSYMLSKCFSEGARAYGNAIEIVKQGGVRKERESE